MDSILCGPPQPPPQSPWVLAAPYPINIRDASVTTLADSLYSFGGQNGSGITRESYRLTGSTWTRITDLPQTGFRPAVAAGEGAYIYIFGGVSGDGTINSSGYRYHRFTTLYGNIASPPTATFGSAAVFLDGKIYKIGGFVNTNGAATDAVEVYSVANNSWTTVAPYPLALGNASAFIHGQAIYVAGGAVGQSLVGTLKAYRYDPPTNTWNDAAFADLPVTRFSAASASYRDGGLVAGGFVNGAGSANVSRSALQWNAQTNTWTSLPDMRLARAAVGGSVLGGCFFAVGGSSRSGAGSGFTGTADVQKFDCVFENGFEP